MLLRLFLLFTLVPVVELALLIKIGQHIGALQTIALLLLSGAIGAGLAKHEGLRTWRMIQDDLAHGRIPTDRLIDGLLILLAGALLITPGVITDGIGFALLLPPARRLVRAYLKKRFQSRIVITRLDGFRGRPDDDLIDVEARPQDD
ncbi:MAG TPA: FxsA family protein [Phycisphaerae bacterium]|nr:FxsA family protein [Phycisphaerae bacterium]